MNAAVTLVSGAVLGMTAGLLLIPLTRRELAAAVTRSHSLDGSSSVAVREPEQGFTWAHAIALAVASGLLLAYVLHRVGWLVNALPPLLLVVGLIQLAYCDLQRRLLPKTLVYGLSAAVIGSGLIIAVFTNEWQRFLWALIGGAISFALFFIVNLMNPRWMAFGDVRLSLVFGFGLAWVSPIDLFEAFFYANVLALAAGLVLIASHRGSRRSAMPFGVFMALGAALVLIT